jgi:RNase P/RNase MRP subunit POP5
MKENKRYLYVKGKNLGRDIEKSILDFGGVLGMSKTGLVWIKSDKSKDLAIIGVNREAVDLVRASFAVYCERIEVSKISGTLRGLGI